MFELKNWVKKGIIYGYINGFTPFSKVTELTANYLLKGILTESDAVEIAEACPEPEEMNSAEEDVK